MIKHLHQAFTFLNNIQNVDQRRWYITKQCFLKLCYYVQRNLVSAVGAVFTEKCAVQVLAALRTHLTWTRTGGRRWFLHPAIVTTTPYQTHYFSWIFNSILIIPWLKFNFLRYNIYAWKIFPSLQCKKSKKTIFKHFQTGYLKLHVLTGL